MHQCTRTGSPSSPGSPGSPGMPGPPLRGVNKKTEAMLDREVSNWGLGGGGGAFVPVIPLVLLNLLDHQDPAMK